MAPIAQSIKVMSQIFTVQLRFKPVKIKVFKHLSHTARIIDFKCLTGQFALLFMQFYAMSMNWSLGLYVLYKECITVQILTSSIFTKTRF